MHFGNDEGEPSVLLNVGICFLVCIDTAIDIRR